ncbi:hypothetical protein DE146DRAFT_750910 [Phaeosphaeria sp. MPI-PUGE-AT-0046c]|nr:hypothetical protein DE146DRAFT_750910 [Phaeosphaeria sp. MPI-PUGE-AT-0046c]
MSYQAHTTGSTDMETDLLDASAHTQSIQSVWTFETNSAKSSSGEDCARLTDAASLHWSPACSRAQSCHNSAEHHQPSSPILTAPSVLEAAVSWDCTTLDGVSQSESDATLHEDVGTFQDKSPNPSTQSIVEATNPDSIDPASIHRPCDEEESRSLDEFKEPEPAFFDGIGLVYSTTRFDASALRVRWIGKSSQRRLGMKLIAETQQDKVQRVKTQQGKSKGQGEEKDRTNSVVGNHEWDIEVEVDMWGVVRPVGIDRGWRA